MSMSAEFSFPQDGVDVTVKAPAFEVDSLRRWLNKINAARTGVPGDVLDDATIDDPDVVVPPPPDRSRPWGVMDVSEASGKPGDKVTVDLFAATDVPILGWMAAIGFESNKLEVVGVEFGDVLTADGRKATPFWRARDRGHPRVGRAGPHIQLAHTGWTLSVPVETPVDEVDPAVDGVTGISPMVLLPPDTVLARITFQIRPEATPGIVPLLNWSGKFGKMPVHHVFTRFREDGINPELADGSITVE